jgi:hypothetical protein
MAIVKISCPGYYLEGTTNEVTPVSPDSPVDVVVRENGDRLRVLCPHIVHGKCGKTTGIPQGEEERLLDCQYRDLSE